MSTTSDAVAVEVPDIGDFEDVPIIEIHVSPGDTVAVDDPLLTLESDKATMDVPAPFPGTVRELLVNVGDKVSQGSKLLTVERSGDAEESTGSKAAAAASESAPSEAAAPEAIGSAAEAEADSASAPPERDSGEPAATGSAQAQPAQTQPAPAQPAPPETEPAAPPAAD